MRARREITLAVICAVLAACSAVASAPGSSHDSTIEGVGLLPAGSPDSVVLGTDPTTTTVSPADPTTTTTPVPPIGTLVSGDRLLMIGDSITASAAHRYGDEFCKALVPLGWKVEVDAEPSRFVDFGNDVLTKRLAAKWDAAYVFLGSNYLGDQESYRKQLEKIVQRLSPIPVLLLTVTLFEDSRQQVNDAITLVAAEFPNVHLLDWGAIATASASTILRGDGLHLTNDGRAVLASTVAGVLGPAPVQDGDCLSTAFHDDGGLSVNGTDIPPKKPVGTPTPTTAKSPTATTVPGGGGTATTKPAATVTTPPPPTQPPVVTTPPPKNTVPRRTDPPTTPPTVAPPPPPAT